VLAQDWYASLEDIMHSYVGGCNQLYKEAFALPEWTDESHQEVSVCFAATSEPDVHCTLIDWCNSTGSTGSTINASST
jgi:hypothetical protein